MKRIAVLIACYNRKNKTVKCIENIKNSSGSDRFEITIYLFDDNSQDGTSFAVTNLWPDVKLIKGSGNAYWARSMHEAYTEASKSQFDAFLMLNDDTFVDSKMFSCFILDWLNSKAGSNDNTVYVAKVADPQSKNVTYSGVRKHKFRFSVIDNSEWEDADTMNGNCVIVSSCIAKKYGFIDPTFQHSMADFDYGLRLRKSGVRIAVSPYVVASCQRNSIAGTHLDSRLSITERLKRATDTKELPLKSWFLFTKRHGGAFWPLYFLAPYLKIILLGATARKD